MEMFYEILDKLYAMTAFSAIGENPLFIVMYLLAFTLLYLGIVKKYEPLLLVPIAFGVLIANFPGGGMGVLQADSNGMVPVTVNGVTELKNIYSMPLHEIAHDLGLMNYLYYALIKSGLLPPIIFMGVGALTDFGPMLRNLKLAIFGAAAQMGIFGAYLLALLLGFMPNEAGAIGIIGGADGPTAIFLSSKLAPDLMGAIAVSAYSYMALVPVIQRPIMLALTNKKERLIRMPAPRQVSQKEKIIFPVVGFLTTAFIVPSGLPLLGMLFFGNLLKESGVTRRLAETARGPLIDTITILIGLTVGASTQADKFLSVKSLKIFGLGLLSFVIATACGVLFVKLMNLFIKNPARKINPLIGNAGVSAVPDSARVSEVVGRESDPSNHLLMHAMGPNVAGVIGSAVAAGILLSFLG